ncbi:MAG: hypothetical protein ACLP1E_12715 [Acidimicrobiales bacterium]
MAELRRLGAQEQLPLLERGPTGRVVQWLAGRRGTEQPNSRPLQLRPARDVDCLAGSAPCLEPSPTTGRFVIDEAQVTFWGVCPDCEQAVS